MNILDHELVRKYFGCVANEDACGGGFSAADHTAYRVICAMHEPIKKGDHFLWYTPSGVWVELEDSAGTDHPGPFHGYVLRLPDAFQKQEKECINCKIFHENTCNRKFECPLHGLDRDERLCTCKPAPSPEKSCSCDCFERAGKACDYCSNRGCKPKDAPNKCDCSRAAWQGHNEKCAIYGPKDAVEEKIKYIQSFFDASDPRKDYARKHMEEELRDLVRLARETK